VGSSSTVQWLSPRASTEGPPQADLTADWGVPDDVTAGKAPSFPQVAALSELVAAKARDSGQRSPAAAESTAFGQDVPPLCARPSTQSVASSTHSVESILQSLAKSDTRGFELGRSAVARIWSGRKATRSTFSFRGAEELRAMLKWVITPWFDYAIAVVIIANAIYLGAQTVIGVKKALEHGEIGESEKRMWVTADIIWAAVFLIEIILRVLAYQWTFFTGTQRWWNAFDCFTMLTSIVAILFDLLNASSSFGVDLLKVLRLARLVRSLRTSRSKVFHTVKVLTYTVAGSANAFLSAILLLWCVMFVFGMFFMQGLQSYLVQLDENTDADAKAALVGYFGSFTRTSLTLLQCITGGTDWANVTDSLLDISWLYACVFAMYIVFTVLCVLNILNGVFVNAAIQSAQTNKELAIDKAKFAKQAVVEQVVQWFVEADEDESGTVSSEEWKRLLEDEKMRDYLLAHNIDASSAGRIFLLLNRKGTGEVGPEEFAENLIALQGSASAIDLASLRVVCEDMAHRVFEMERTVRDAFGDADLPGDPQPCLGL
jgi:hypothetical protein